MEFLSENIWYMGFFVGLIHVLTGPDHLAAIAPLVVHKRAHALMAGVRWGIGHCAGVLLVGVLLVLARDLLPLQEISSYSERLVGVVLIALGVWGWRKALGLQVHGHVHDHDGHQHAHIHIHSPGHTHSAEELDSAHGRHAHTAVAVGVLHGFAGSAHLLGILPALAMPSLSQTVLWLLSFALGTILGMAGFSFVLGKASNAILASNKGALSRLLQGVSGLTVVVGCAWLVI